MSYCLNRCTTVGNETTYSGVWYVIRNYFGPRPDSMSTEIPDENGVLYNYRLKVYEEDIEEYYYWVDAWNTVHNGGIVETPIGFGKWLIWKLSIGTAEYGNLPTHKVNNHSGISCIPCPYDGINISSDFRSELWIGFVPSTRTAHGNYYMKVASRGSSWGFECTSDLCPYFIETGHRYFHV
jgi:hypothetical protein